MNRKIILVTREKMPRLKWFSLAVFAPFLVGCVPIRTYTPPETTATMNPAITENELSGAEKAEIRVVRVAIVVQQPSVNLTIPQGCVLSGLPSSWTGTGDDLEAAKTGYFEKKLFPSSIHESEAYLQPPANEKVQVNGKSYNGSIHIVKELPGTLTVINELDLEEYVMGVLAGEVPRNWPLEALKAQAIAARTFAIYKQAEARRHGTLYDFENNASFQMYGGSELVNDNIQKAVLATRSEILTYKSEPILAFFHSNCGGRTARASDVFTGDIPYLQSESCSFGDGGGHFLWRTEIPTADLVRKLRKSGIGLSDVVRLSAVERDESGRIKMLSIMDADGRSRTIKGSDFRMKIGPDIIRSTRFDAQVGRDKIVFSGRGWGHGVGLCQEGAYGMALRGYGAFDILRHYYRGIMIEKIKE